MSCDYLKTVWQPNTGGPVVFQEPKTIEKGLYTELQIKCGGCTGCRIDKKVDWTIRCIHEAQLHDNNQFLTLTYDDDHLPDDLSLDHSHIQKFLKRLRRKYPENQIRFLVCGEYGKNTKRAHYHMLLFGSPVPMNQLVFFKENANGNRLYNSPELEKIWGMGAVVIGLVTKSSIGYTVGYTLKDYNTKFTNEVVDGETGEIIERKPPYIRMSNRPAIGLKWFEKFQDDVFPHDYVIIDGRKNPVPDYYFRKLKETDPAMHKLVFDKRLKEMETERFKENNTPERREVKKIVRDSKLKMYKNREVQ